MTSVQLPGRLFEGFRTSGDEVSPGIDVYKNRVWKAICRFFGVTTDIHLYNDDRTVSYTVTVNTKSLDAFLQKCVPGSAGDATKTISGRFFEALTGNETVAKSLQQNIVAVAPTATSMNMHIDVYNIFWKPVDSSKVARLWQKTIDSNAAIAAKIEAAGKKLYDATNADEYFAAVAAFREIGAPKDPQLWQRFWHELCEGCHAAMNNAKLAIVRHDAAARLVYALVEQYANAKTDFPAALQPYKSDLIRIGWATPGYPDTSRYVHLLNTKIPTPSPALTVSFSTMNLPEDLKNVIADFKDRMEAHDYATARKLLVDHLNAHPSQLCLEQLWRDVGRITDTQLRTQQLSPADQASITQLFCAAVTVRERLYYPAPQPVAERIGYLQSIFDKLPPEVFPRGFDQANPDFGALSNKWILDTLKIFPDFVQLKQLAASR